MKTAATPTAVRDFIRSLNTWFSLEENESDADTGFLYYTTRRHGNVGDETPGEADFDEARRVAEAVREKFGDVVDPDYDDVDEWVNLSFEVGKN